MSRAELSPWRAVYVRAASEWSVSAGLRAAGLDVLLLWERTVVRHARQIEERRRALFTRYVLAAVDGMAVPEVPGIIGLVRAGERALAIPIEVVEELRGRGDANGLVTTPTFPVGSKHRIIAGPLEGLIATIAAVDGPRVRCWVSMFRRRTSAEVTAAQLAPPAKHATGKITERAPAPPRPPPAWTPERRALLQDTVRRFYKSEPLLRRQVANPDASGFCQQCRVNCFGHPPRPPLPCGVRGCPYERASE